ncbi:3,4-dihydroxy-2-butanone-4-phosphate synthase [Mariniflexile sp. AS56]|uniref:3,4-dihydroxy-2-butanone-4-phosphate synthase n=1 Tax=Mariniflexile sp. AS56 TaxID=3063957 RepID=UPI0026EBE36C|nr:3,4-dihydroxy-2-butanone-4-phosphate synthase [Mariniflexile sp. AS56]MDO7173091.1 3,4-dihydroxy-2-butanone-4-phosphate synthase [Mariniflexile sp. AS56]
MILAEIDTLQTIDINSQERLEKVLKHLQNGKGIILMDDEDRENEGDFVSFPYNRTV